MSTDLLDKPAGLASPFVRTLVRLMRAEDSYGTWEGRADADLLADFIVTREQRREIPIIGDPDPDVLWRLEKFYAAVGIDIERVTGRIASPMKKPLFRMLRCVSVAPLGKPVVPLVNWMLMGSVAFSVAATCARRGSSGLPRAIRSEKRSRPGSSPPTPDSSIQTTVCR